MPLNQQEGLLIGVLYLFIMSALFTTIAFLYHKKQNNKTKQLQCRTEGKIEEVIDGWTKGLGGKPTDKHIVYSYEVNGHRYIVKPYVLDKDSELNTQYKNDEHCTCITYMGPHNGVRQTKYLPGEPIAVLYDESAPQNHVILDNKDQSFFSKAFYIAAIIHLVLAIIVFIIAIFLLNNNTFPFLH